MSRSRKRTLQSEPADAVLADEDSSLSDEPMSADDGDSSVALDDDDVHADEDDAADSAEERGTIATRDARPPTRWWVSAHASKRAAAAAAAAAADNSSASGSGVGSASPHTAAELRSLADAIAAQEHAAAEREAAHVQRHHELLRALSLRTEREERLERSVADLSLRIRRFEQQLVEKMGDPSNGFPDSSLRLSAAASLSALRTTGAPTGTPLPGAVPEPRLGATPSPLPPPSGASYAANGAAHSISPPGLF